MFDSWPAVSLLQCVREEQLDLHTVKKKVFSQLTFNSLYESIVPLYTRKLGNKREWHSNFHATTENINYKKNKLKKLSRIRTSCGLIFFRFVRWSTARKGLFFLGAFFLLIPTLSSRSRSPFLRALSFIRETIMSLVSLKRSAKLIMFLEI